MSWQPIETCPLNGFFLVYEDGAMRTMNRDAGQWSSPGIPVKYDEWGDAHVVDSAAISDVVQEPSHLMPLPALPECD